MAHDRNIGIGDGRNRGRDPDAAFNFDGAGAAFLEEAAGVFEPLLRTDLEAHERHVGDEQAAVHATRHAARMVDHLVERHAQRMLVTLHHHAERIADQDSIHAGRVEQAAHGVIVGGQQREPHPAGLGREEVRHRHRLIFIASRASGTARALGRLRCGRHSFSLA